MLRMGQKRDDYSGFQPKITPPKHFSRAVYITQSIKMQIENVMGTPLETTLAQKGPAIIIPTYSRSYTHKHKSYLQQEKAVVRKINTMQRLQWGQGGAATCIITCPHFKKLHMPLLWKYLSQKVISYHTGRQQ